MVAYNNSAFAEKPRELTKQEIIDLLEGRGPTLLPQTIEKLRTALAENKPVMTGEFPLDFIPTRPL
jgi:hypothetical protein